MAKTIPAEKYVEGVNSIYAEQPGYKTGHDGSDGYCDCIGMGRGSLHREGVTDTPNMYGTNQAARFAILNLQPVDVNQLRLGDVVLKTRDKDDPDMPLPDKYRKGGSGYTGDETNYTHFGTVTRVKPLEITHMTSPKPKKDTKIGNWKYMGQLPWVDYHQADPDPEPEPAKRMLKRGSRGDDVKELQEKLKQLYYDIGPAGADGIFGTKTEAAVKDFQRDHDLKVDGIAGPDTFNALDQAIGPQQQLYTVTIKHLDIVQASALCNAYENASKKEERLS